MITYIISSYLIYAISCGVLFAIIGGIDFKDEKDNQFSTFLGIVGLFAPITFPIIFLIGLAYLTYYLVDKIINK